MKGRNDWNNKIYSSSCVLLNWITKTIETETTKKNQNEEFAVMLLGTLGASFLENMLTGKGIVRAGYRNKEGKGIVGTGYGKKKLIPLHPLTNIEIQEYYQNESRFNGFYSRDNLLKTIKDVAYVINLVEHPDVGTRWIALFLLNIETIYFDIFRLEHVPKEI